ncbi:hypothetical protein JKP88DRAFT_264963 [Tribonema minus]|uniref:Phytanoyl-CoA dioxygenase n=1 Tax=Tribonema minus TaxID=303371 RepID=A0A835YLL8_9STRA|nr:hypothetical protein JKP88DRAFT_264963 [Tribonema minus]
MQAAFALFDEDDENEPIGSTSEGTSTSSLPIPTPAITQLKSLQERVTVQLEEAEQHTTAQPHAAFSETTHNACVSVLRRHGVLLLKGLFDPALILEWRSRVLADMDVALAAVPASADRTTLRYKELASRQAARFEVRNGAQMKAGEAQGQAAVLSEHPGVVRVILEAFACPGQAPLPLSDMRAWRDVGAFVSLPGATAQQLHADLDHLFFSGPHLPPHYVTMFLPALTPDDGALDPRVGQTEFFPGTHTVAAAAKVLNGETAPSISPQLQAGDAVLYDARLLHRGLGNSSKSTRRPILYVNFQRSWFEDQQNWGQESVFDASK